MNKKTNVFVTTVIGGVVTIASACVTFLVDDKTLAAQIVVATGVVATAAIDVCNIFTKNDA